MYGPLAPLPYEVMRDRLEHFDIIECGEDDGIGGCCRVFRLFRMGCGTGTYYNFPFDGNKAIITEPEIAGVLDYFGIDHARFMSEDEA